MEAERDWSARARGEMFSPLRSSRRSDEVYDRLLGVIHDGRFEPGVRPPPERDMADDRRLARRGKRRAGAYDG